MPRAAELPAVFARYAPLVRCVQVESAGRHTYTSSCPNCGGDIHPDGEWSDRCCWFADDHPLGVCRGCGARFFPDAQHRPSTQQQDAWRQRELRRQEERRRAAERVLRRLAAGRVWERYHDDMDAAARAYWRARGIPDSYQDLWELGWRRAYRTHRADGTPHVTAAATIPIFDGGRRCRNVKLRLIDPPTSADHDKYRVLVSGQGQHLYLCWPETPLQGHVIAVEGEIKSAVTFVTLDDPRAVVVGLPGKAPGQAVLDQLAAAERLTLVLDPGAERAAQTLAERLGRERCRVLVTSEKIDDAILRARMTAGDLRRWLRQARQA